MRAEVFPSFFLLCVRSKFREEEKPSGPGLIEPLAKYFPGPAQRERERGATVRAKFYVTVFFEPLAEGRKLILRARASSHSERASLSPFLPLPSSPSGLVGRKN